MRVHLTLLALGALSTLASAQNASKPQPWSPEDSERALANELSSLEYASFAESSAFADYSSRVNRTRAIDGLARCTHPLTRLAAYYWLSREEPELRLRWAIETIRLTDSDAGSAIPAVLSDCPTNNLAQWHADILKAMTCVHWASPIPVVAVLGEVPQDELKKWGRNASRSIGDSTFEAALLSRLWKLLTLDGDNPRLILASELDSCKEGTVFARCIYLDYATPETREYDEVLTDFVVNGDLRNPSVRRALRSRSEYIAKRELVQSSVIGSVRMAELQEALSR